MENRKEGIIYRVTEGPFRYQAWPSVCIDENGVIYAACSGHRSSHVCPFGKNLMFVSTDNGETWSAPQIINDTWLDDRDAGLSYLGDGKMVLAYFNHPKDAYIGVWRNWILDDGDKEFRPMLEGFLKAYEAYTPEQDRSGSFVKLSNNYGKTWGEAIKIPVSAPHGAVKTISGRLLYLGKEFSGTINRYDSKYDDSYDTVPAEERYHIYLYESFDDGATWEKVSKLPTEKVCGSGDLHEPHIVELPNGELIGAIRAHDDPKLDRFSTYFISSTDGGKTWGDIWSLGMIGSPPHLLLRKDGSVVISYGRRSNPCGIRAVVSYDGCRTFSEEYILSDAPDGDLGYPATVELDDGSLLTVYYKKYGKDNRTSIMYTKWKA